MLTEAEYRMLKAQVNPHFLFNTLGTVHSLIRINPGNARSCVKDLSDLLRRALEHSEEMVPLQAELDLVYAYVRLEKARFRERIQVEEDIETQALSGKLPVFTLQPLVENAIRHGLSPKLEGGILTIRIWRDNSHIAIEVTDNGVGIAADKLAAITRFDGSAAKYTSGAGIGLSNVNKRLRLAFGPSYGLRITSTEGGGTRILTAIPAELAKEESS